jgi:hypothetical protein
MADLSDVENAVVALASTALYPSGFAQPSITTALCRIYRGWPSPTTLNSDLAAGTVNVTVFPSATPDETPPQYFDHVGVAITPASLTATVAGTTVTFAGEIAVGEMLGILVDGMPYVYRISGSDTLQSVAANMGAILRTDWIVSLSGTSLILLAAYSLIARVAPQAVATCIMRRHRRELRICCWCPSQAIRDNVCKSVDLALASSPIVALADGTTARIHYLSTQVYDQSVNALLYRRDLHYICEYMMTATSVLPCMLFGDLVSREVGTIV